MPHFFPVLHIGYLTCPTSPHENVYLSVGAFEKMFKIDTAFLSYVELKLDEILEKNSTLASK